MAASSEEENLKAQLAAVTAERDEAQVWAGSYAVQLAALETKLAAMTEDLDDARAARDDLMRELEKWRNAALDLQGQVIDLLRKNETLVRIFGGPEETAEALSYEILAEPRKDGES